MLATKNDCPHEIEQPRVSFCALEACGSDKTQDVSDRTFYFRKRRSIMKKFIVPFPILIGVLFLSIGVFFVETVMYVVFFHKKEVVMSDVRCHSESVEVNSDNRLMMKIACGERSDLVQNNKFILEFLKEKQPFSCTLYKGASAECHFLSQ